MGINRIATNITSLSAQRNVNQTGLNLQRSIERLSSGLRINRAGDDAAGLTVANRLRTQSQGLNVAVANAQDGINVISVAEGALEETTNRLSRIRELALQAANTGVNDFGARSALQDEVFQSIDEITRIANTTLFSNNFLLKGDFSITSELKDGVQNVGANLDVSPVASNLGNGTAFLNIRQVKDGFKQITSGEASGQQQILNTGITNQSDVAVSLALFTEGAVGLQSSLATGLDATGDSLAASFFNGVSMARDDIFTFSGLLSDGVTSFNGALSVVHVGGAITFQGITSAVGEAIADAEAALFGGTANVPAEFRTIAAASTTGSNAGRILLRSSENSFSEADLNITLVNANGDIRTSSNGVVRAQEIGNQSFLAGQGQVGNLVTAVTGSTFADGEFAIQVEDVQSAQQRIVENSLVFRDGNGAILNSTTSLVTSGNSSTLLLNGTFVSGVFTGGTTLRNGDTVDFTGTTSDGTTFQSTFTFNGVPGAGDFDADLGDFTFSSISGIISELNFRTRDYNNTAAPGATDGEQTRFEDALFTFTAGGQIQLIDDLGRTDSQSNFTFTFNFSAGGARTSNSTIQDDGNLIKEGFAESATFRVDGGEAVRAEAGDVVTLFGEESTAEGVPSPQVTIRVGNGFAAGNDTFENERDLYTGALNGGPIVTFQAGDQDVVFLSQTTGGEAAKFVTFDFEDVIEVTSTFTGSDPGFTVLISTVNKGLNFQIGSGADQNIKFSLGDLRADNLGFGRSTGRTVSDIDITSLTGANEAIRIIDESLDQVNRTRSILGAATNRLESTVANLTVASENLTASESRIRDADIAAETTRFTQNQVLLQAGVSVLAQANFQSQGFLQLLG